jgi:hypothetical protein
MFDSFYFDLGVTTMALRFQALKEKEGRMVENAPVESPSGDHPIVAVDLEIMKIVSWNLTSSYGQETTKTVAGATPNEADQEGRAEV